jgi:hypothetical protein
MLLVCASGKSRRLNAPLRQNSRRFHTLNIEPKPKKIDAKLAKWNVIHCVFTLGLF